MAVVIARWTLFVCDPQLESPALKLLVDRRTDARRHQHESRAGDDVGTDLVEALEVGAERSQPHPSGEQPHQEIGHLVGEHDAGDAEGSQPDQRPLQVDIRWL